MQDEKRVWVFGMIDTHVVTDALNTQDDMSWDRIFVLLAENSSWGFCTPVAGGFKRFFYCSNYEPRACTSRLNLAAVGTRQARECVWWEYNTSNQILMNLPASHYLIVTPGASNLWHNNSMECSIALRRRKEERERMAWMIESIREIRSVADPFDFRYTVEYIFVVMLQEIFWALISTLGQDDHSVEMSPLHWY